MTNTEDELVLAVKLVNLPFPAKMTDMTDMSDIAIVKFLQQHNFGENEIACLEARAAREHRTLGEYVWAQKPREQESSWTSDDFCASQAAEDELSIKKKDRDEGLSQ